MAATCQDNQVLGVSGGVALVFEYLCFKHTLQFDTNSVISNEMFGQSTDVRALCSDFSILI